MTSKTGMERKYVVGQNGLFEKYEDKLFKATIKAQKDESLPEIKETAEYIGPKIPASLLKTALGFLNWCYEEHQSEGCLMMRMRNEEWSLVCPTQYVGGAHVCYHPDQIEASGIMADIHSHPGMTKGHSGTDHIDEAKYGGLAVVVNRFKLIGCDPEIIGSMRSVRFKFDADDIFDEVESGGDYSFPEEWKEKVIPGECTECEPKVTKVSHGRNAMDYDWSDYGVGSNYDRKTSYRSPYQTGSYGGNMYFTSSEYKVAEVLRGVFSGRTSLAALLTSLVSEEFATKEDVVELLQMSGQDVRDIQEEAQDSSADAEDALREVEDVKEVSCLACGNSRDSFTCDCGQRLSVEELAMDIVAAARMGAGMEEPDLTESDMFGEEEDDNGFPLVKDPNPPAKPKEKGKKKGKKTKVTVE